jgi:hypothetical protein
VRGGAHRRHAERAVQPAQHQERRGHEAQLDDLRVVEVRVQISHERVVDRGVIAGQPVREIERRPLARCAARGVLQLR